MPTAGCSRFPASVFFEDKDCFLHLHLVLWPQPLCLQQPQQLDPQARVTLERTHSHYGCCVVIGVEHGACIGGKVGDSKS